MVFSFDRCIFRRRWPWRKLHAIFGPRRMSLRMESAGASTALTASRISMNTGQTRLRSSIISPGGKKTPAQSHPLYHQRGQNLGLHPGFGGWVVALGHMAEGQQTLESLERQFNLPAQPV